MSIADNIQQAALLVSQADGLLVTAGAGIDVDSGLPDFRGDAGFWKAYPPLARAGIRFVEIASPASFADSPEQAWGFYGHRLQLYRETVPHNGFAILQRLGSELQHGSFVFTSNVDGQFQKAGFHPDSVVECHGSIHFLQCLAPCSNAIWPAATLTPDIDLAECRLISPLPACPRCAGLARPNILMFNDSGWVADRTDLQYDRLEAWLHQVRQPVIIEIGAGTAIPSVRDQGEALGAPVIRINPVASDVRRKVDVALPMNALDALLALSTALPPRHAAEPD